MTAKQTFVRHSLVTRLPLRSEEKANHSAAQRWWRTLPDDIDVTDAEARLDAFCAAKGDTRIRVIDHDGNTATVAELAAAERLRGVPLEPFPATITVSRTVRPQAEVAFRSNRYSTPPELVASIVTITHRLGTATLDVSTGKGVVIARHRRAPDGAKATVHADGHVHALESAVLAAFTTAPPHRKKVRLPPGPAALAAAEQLRARRDPQPSKGTSPNQTGQVVTDLTAYAAAAKTRRTLP